MKNSAEITVIIGPTASGKSKLAIDFAKKIGGEIICADSRSVYKDFDIVSAKPTPIEQNGVAHHLLDVVLPSENFSAGEFKTLGTKAIEDILNRNKKVIICGGTWFYVSSLLGLNNLPKVPPNVALREELEKKSTLVLFDMLLDLNEKRAREIEPNNRERVIRALEVNMAGNLLDENEVAFPNVKFYTPKIEREELYLNINKRVDLMIQVGLREEYLKNKQKYGALPIFNSTIGYREFEKLTDGEYESFEFAIEKIKQHTRNFAKRQLTWLRGFDDGLLVQVTV